MPTRPGDAGVEARRQELLDETDRYLAELVQIVGEPSPRAVDRAETLARRIRREFLA